MLRTFAIVNGLLLAAISYADVCSYVTKDQAELGAKLLRINPNFVKYCAPCSEKSKMKIRAEKIEARPIENDQYWGVFVNDQNIDLAYTYVDIGEKNGISLANLSGCQTPYDVPRMIDITDVVSAAKAETKAVQAEVKSATAEPRPNVAMQTNASEQDLLEQADQYFKKSDFASAVRIYEQLLERDQSKSGVLNPKITKCYYNLGVQTIHKATLRGSKKDCVRAADYFTQTLYLDENDTEARDALNTANMCKELGPNLPKVKDEIDNLSVFWILVRRKVHRLWAHLLISVRRLL
jgi:tetratricopeptide (TPR) repeat protein